MIVTAGPEDPAQEDESPVPPAVSGSGDAPRRAVEDDVEPWRGRYPYPPWIAEEDVQ